MIKWLDHSVLAVIVPFSDPTDPVMVDVFCTICGWRPSPFPISELEPNIHDLFDDHEAYQELEKHTLRLRHNEFDGYHYVAVCDKHEWISPPIPFKMVTEEVDAIIREHVPNWRKF